MKTGKYGRCPENGGEKEARETEVATRSCIKTDPVNVEEGLRKRATYAMNWDC